MSVQPWNWRREKDEKRHPRGDNDGWRDKDKDRRKCRK
jgi:hypothetical protein